MPENEDPGSVRSAVANALVAVKKQHYGKGPEAAKAYFNDEYLFVVMEGGLTRNEETLLAAGHGDLVRRYRLTFQEAMRDTICGAVEELVGRRVVTYQSQILFDPVRVIEMFMLDHP